MTVFKFILSVTCLFFVLLGAEVQGQTQPISWEYIHTGGQFNYQFAGHTWSMPNGHFLNFGYGKLPSTPPNHKAAYLIELDAYGRHVRSQTLPQMLNGADRGPIYAPLDHGEFLLLGKGATGNTLARYDSLWVQQWQIADTNTLDAFGITSTSDGGIMVSGGKRAIPTSLIHGQMTKRNGSGFVLWDSIYTSIPGEASFGDIREYPGTNAGFAVVDLYVGAGIGSNDSAGVYSFSSTGQLQWTIQIRAGIAPNTGIPDCRLEMLPSGEFWVATSGAFLTKFDSSGNVLQSKRHAYPNTPGTEFRDLTAFSDGSGAVMFENHPASPEGNSVIRFDAMGDTMWTRYFDTRFGQFFAQGITNYIDTTENHGLILGGIYQQKSWMVRLDSLGNYYQNEVCGTVFLDANGNCLKDSFESVLPYWLVKEDPDLKYALTNANGQYQFKLDSGQHWLSIGALPYPHDINCSPFDSIFVNFPGVMDTLCPLDIPISIGALDSCALMKVDITSPAARVCQSGTIFITYQNLGGIAAPAAYVIVTLDPALTLTSAQLPFSTVGPNMYRVDIGMVAPFQGGIFTMEAFTNCSTETRQAICNVAHIYPDSTCLPPNPLWNGASLGVTGSCIPGDSVRFVISNDGTGNMLQRYGFIVVEDDILRLADSIQLNIGADTILTFYNPGKTWALFADQVAYHPDNSIPRAFVEGCGRDIFGDFSVGHVANHPQDDAALYESIFCYEARAAYDPNDKQGFPLGVGTNHGILATDDMEYLIRFQNTGNDTAFKVVVRDRISENYDLSTFQMVAASHSPYTVQFYPDRVVEWTFDPIALPDSGADLAGSQGFLKFTIEQVSGNLPGTEIENFVDIYFDHNSAIRTNTAWHTVYAELKDLITVVEDPVLPGEPTPIPFRVYPNPFSEQTTLEFPDSYFKQVQLELYDQQGRLVRKLSRRSTNSIVLKREQLPAGIYFFRIIADQNLLKSGKVLVRNR